MKNHFALEMLASRGSFGGIFSGSGSLSGSCRKRGVGDGNAWNGPVNKEARFVAIKYAGLPGMRQPATFFLGAAFAPQPYSESNPHRPHGKKHPR